MSDKWLAVLEAVILVSALSADALIASFSYGVNKIKIPFSSVLIISVISTAILTAALYAGAALSNVITPLTASIISSVILISIGILKLADSLVKTLIRKHKSLKKDFKFSFLSLKFILCVYADPEDADTDASKSLSAREAIPLAFALSIDSLTVGIGAGMTDTNFIMCIVFSIVFSVIAIFMGSFLGRKLAARTSLNISWLGGVFFIALAISKLVM